MKAEIVTATHRETIAAQFGQMAADMLPYATQPQGVDVNAVLAKIALCHTELSEAVEAVRDGRYVAYLKDGKPEGMVVELADALIRIAHLADLLGLDLEDAVEMKMAANEKRPYRHGGKLA